MDLDGEDGRMDSEERRRTDENGDFRSPSIPNVEHVVPRAACLVDLMFLERREEESLTFPQSQQPSTFKRFVEVGRVVLVNDGPSAGKLAVIAEIIDHNRALIDGPTTSVPRQAFPYRHLILTPYTIAKLPRGAGTGAVKKAFEKAGVLEKWQASAWSKKLAARQVRKVSKPRGPWNMLESVY